MRRVGLLRNYASQAQVATVAHKMSILERLGARKD